MKRKLRKVMKELWKIIAGFERVHIGYFDTEEEAKAARKAKVATL